MSEISSTGNLRWMEEALQLAMEAASQGEVPVGCVIVKEGRVVGRGYNLRESNQDPLAHAEILAIRDAARTLGSWRLTGCHLYVTLEPCPMCLGACQQARIQDAHFGALDPKGGALSLGYFLHENQQTNHRFPVSPLLIPQCGEVLSRFFGDRRKP